MSAPSRSSVTRVRCRSGDSRSAEGAPVPTSATPIGRDDTASAQNSASGAKDLVRGKAKKRSQENVPESDSFASTPAHHGSVLAGTSHHGSREPRERMI